MSAFDLYCIQQLEMKNLIKNFGFMCSNIGEEIIGFAEWRNLYGIYMSFANKGVKSFDYVTYGKILSNCNVFIRNSVEKEIYNQEKSILVDYLKTLAGEEKPVVKKLSSNIQK